MEFWIPGMEMNGNYMKLLLGFVFLGDLFFRILSYGKSPLNHHQDNIFTFSKNLKQIQVFQRNIFVDQDGFCWLLSQK